MGIYFNPPSQIAEIGRKLELGSFEHLTAQLQPGEVLVGLYDRIRFKNAPHLYSAGELEAFESQVRDGIIFRIGIFAVDEEKFKEGI